MLTWSINLNSNLQSLDFTEMLTELCILKKKHLQINIVATLDMQSYLNNSLLVRTPNLALPGLIVDTCILGLRSQCPDKEIARSEEYPSWFYKWNNSIINKW